MLSPSGRWLRRPDGGDAHDLAHYGHHCSAHAANESSLLQLIAARPGLGEARSKASERADRVLLLRWLCAQPHLGADPTLHEGFRDVRNNEGRTQRAAYFGWLPDGCTSEPRFDAAAFARHFAGGAQLLLVGDSLTQQHFVSLFCLLSEEIDEDATRALLAHPLRDEAGPSEARITGTAMYAFVLRGGGIVRAANSDLLVWATPRESTLAHPAGRADKSHSAVFEVPAGERDGAGDGTQLTYYRPLSPLPRLQEAWGAWLRVGSRGARDVLVLNSGAHWWQHRRMGFVTAAATRVVSADTPLFGHTARNATSDAAAGGSRTTEDEEEELELEAGGLSYHAMVHTVLSFLRRADFRGHTFYRTNFAPGCSADVDAPAERVPVVPVSLGPEPSHTSPTRFNGSVPYGWDGMALFDELWARAAEAERTAANTSAQQPGSVRGLRRPLRILNVSVATSQRVDGHCVTCNAKHNDCLHYCLPGAPDQWSVALQAALGMRMKGARGGRPVCARRR